MDGKGSLSDIISELHGSAKLLDDESQHKLLLSYDNLKAQRESGQQGHDTEESNTGNKVGVFGDLMLEKEFEKNMKIEEIHKKVNIAWTRILDPIFTNNNTKNFYLLYTEKYIQKFDIDFTGLMQISLKILKNFEGFSESILEIAINLARISI